MEYQGNILKMDTVLEDPVQYVLPIGDQRVDMNALLGKKVQFRYEGRINCTVCGKRTKTSFGQGFCYSCFKTAPQAGESVVFPELSRAEFGVARDIDWAVANDLIDHYVYLAVTRDVKVGVTRSHQVPVRWIDQGADRVIKLAKTPNRHVAGVIETFLKKYYKDVTNWREMLLNHVDEQTDLVAERERAIGLLPLELRQYVCEGREITYIHYPVLEYPDKVVGQNFDKEPFIGGTLTGIRGQYLLFDRVRALNIRRHNGYFLTLATE